MSKVVLFSPVGGTDPVSESNYCDGAMIHILRRHNPTPDKVYLYMSKEMLERSAKDNRYEYCIDQLSKHMKHSFEVVRIEKPNMVDVHLFEPIYRDFERKLSDIRGTLDDGDLLLLNISSGTPAMKSALLILATMMDIECRCIQVDTPTHSMNEHIHEENLDLEALWDLNPDNSREITDPNYNRSHEEHLPSLRRLKMEASIREFVNNYNYHAAYVLAMNLPYDDTSAYLNKLLIADKRLHLDLVEVNELIKNCSPDEKKIYRPIGTSGIRKVYEYLLVLQAKVAKGEYADFARGIGPLIDDLYEAILKKNGFIVSQYIRNGKPGKRIWDIDKLKHSGGEVNYFELLNDEYSGEFLGGRVNAAHLIILCDGIVTDSNTKKCIHELRHVEETVRNVAAHNMICVTDDWVKTQTNKTSDQIIQLLRKAFTYSAYQDSQTSWNWNSYDDMNQDIFSAMDKIQM